MVAHNFSNSNGSEADAAPKAGLVSRAELQNLVNSPLRMHLRHLREMRIKMAIFYIFASCIERIHGNLNIKLRRRNCWARFLRRNHTDRNIGLLRKAVVEFVNHIGTPNPWDDGNSESDTPL